MGVRASRYSSEEYPTSVSLFQIFQRTFNHSLTLDHQIQGVVVCCPHFVDNNREVKVFARCHTVTLAESPDPWFSLLYLYCLPPRGNISLKFLQFPPNTHTSPHYPFTFSWEIGLIGTNCPATAKSIVLPVARGTCAACYRTQTIWGTKD